ncbi:hypothetical protein J3459_012428 [Metarhizium acridum]|uniref:uncharacterized protein n=1 Tax=Metarhizium acridum TaxID=92637 RepID=UPI001C6C3E2B|nr:hypothetical protein J3458_021318 [Metarhizium acridum]KAG8417335.1 hypothetical protein J3459_012428 [Metarhizium acridum]
MRHKHIDQSISRQVAGDLTKRLAQALWLPRQLVRGGAPAQAPETLPTHDLLQQTFINFDSLRIDNFSSITRMQRCLPGMAGNPTFATHRTAHKRHHRSTHDTVNPCGRDDNATTPHHITSKTLEFTVGLEQDLWLH